MLCDPIVTIIELMLITAKPHIYHNAKTTQVIQRRRQSNIKLKCPVVGHPRPTVMWFHNGEQLTDTEARKGRITLIINDLKPEDSGNYTCLAKNSYGEVAYSFILEVIGMCISLYLYLCPVLVLIL